MTDLIQSPAWKALQVHFDDIKDTHMRDMFKENTNRFDEFSTRLNDILLDYSKNRITGTTLKLLMDLARQSTVEERSEERRLGEECRVRWTGSHYRDNGPIIWCKGRKRRTDES